MYDLAASSYDRLKNKRLCIVNISKSLAATAGAKRFAGLAPMGEMKRMVEGDAASVWHAKLVGKWGGPGEGGADSPAELPASASDEEKKAHAKKMEDAELLKTKLPQVMFATLNHVFKVGDVWKMRGGKADMKPVMEHADVVGKSCYALGQQMFAAEAWKECQRPLRAAAALLMHNPYQQGAACHYLACAYVFPIEHAPPSANAHTRPASWRFTTGRDGYSNPSYHGVQGLPFPIPDIPIPDIHAAHTRLTLSCVSCQLLPRKQLQVRRFFREARAVRGWGVSKRRGGAVEPWAKTPKGDQRRDRVAFIPGAGFERNEGLCKRGARARTSAGDRARRAWRQSGGNQAVLAIPGGAETPNQGGGGERRVGTAVRR